jgi:hypothetical protein
MESELEIGNLSLGNDIISLVESNNEHYCVVRAKHCHDSIMTNIDNPKWLLKTFLNCVPKLEEATKKTHLDCHKIFLSYLIIDLLKVDTLPTELIKELASYYKWPFNLATLKSESQTTDPLVGKLLMRVFDQENLGVEEDIVDKQYLKMLRIRKLKSFFLSLLCILFLVAGKYLYANSDWIKEAILAF